jgi:DNA-binding MurR/RpiR family transcriptional regulator
LIYYNHSEVANLHEEIEPEDSSEQLLAKVFRTSIQAIEETSSILDVAAFDRAAELLFKARYIICMPSVAPLLSHVTCRISS